MLEIQALDVLPDLTPTQPGDSFMDKIKKNVVQHNNVEQAMTTTTTTMTTGP
jgi:hypothetical protein